MKNKAKQSVSVLLCLTLLVSMLLTGCAGQTPAPAPDAETAAAYKEDFYEAVNKEWLATAKIPDGKVSNGTVDEIREQNDKKCFEILQVLMSGTHKEGSAQQKLADFYAAALDVGSRDTQGVEPIQKYINAYGDAKSIAELMQADLMAYHEIGRMQLFAFGAAPDVKNSSQSVLYGASIEPYLSKEEYQSESSMAAYEELLTTQLVLAGESAENAAEGAKQVIALEKAISESQMDVEEYYDLGKSYNEYTVDSLGWQFPLVKIESVLGQIGFDKVEKIIISDVPQLKKTAEYFTEQKLDNLKWYAKSRLILGYGTFLSDAFIQAGVKFNQAVYGIQGSRTTEQRALASTQDYLAGYLEQFYIEKYFDSSAKQDVEEMVQDFIAVYKTKIHSAEWMSDTTKEKAIKKLDTMQVKVGYPDVQEDDLQNTSILGPEEGKNNYIKNVFEIEKEANKLNREELAKPVDKTEWNSPAFLTNAFYSPTDNAITFPAGFLQAPLYDVNAPEAQNLGSIGVVIAHEISHAFDSSGSQYDENGNAVDWWLPEDHKRFEEQCQKIIKAYDGIEVADGVTNDGELTLTENIADLGGISCSLAVLSQAKDPDYASFFKSWANVWKQVITPETQKHYSQIDTHSLNKVRANRTISNFEEFYETFGVKEGDGMYIPPEERVSLW